MGRVDVVILNWNGKHHLERFLPSVVANTPAHVGIVVADNGSEDGSREMLQREFPRVEVLPLDANYGFAEGYNRALGALQADYFILLNSDVEVTPGWCEPLIESIEGDERIAAASPKILSYERRDEFEYAGASGGFIDWLGYPFCRGRILSTIEKDEGQYDDPRGIFWASGACMIVRAEVFHQLGGFDASFFAHMEEIDLCWRAALYGYRMVVEPRSRVYHLGGGTLNKTSPNKIYLNFRNTLATLFKNLPQGRAGRVVFLRMTLDAFSALVYLVGGKRAYFKAVWRAHTDFRRMKPDLRLKREVIRENMTRTPDYIYRRSILLRYALGKKTFGDIL